MYKRFSIKDLKCIQPTSFDCNTQTNKTIISPYKIDDTKNDRNGLKFYLKMKIIINKSYIFVFNECKCKINASLSMKKESLVVLSLQTFQIHSKID